jgi:hypothetical protein
VTKAPRLTISDDDLYGRDLLKSCIDALDAYPGVVLAHSWTAIIDDAGTVTRAVPYTHATGALLAPGRFRSLLFDYGGDDDGGIIKMSVLRQTALNGSYYRADRTFVSELALYGRFYHIPEWLYFRRDHPARAARALRSVHGWCVNLDPRGASRLPNPARAFTSHRQFAGLTTAPEVPDIPVDALVAGREGRLL